MACDICGSAKHTLDEHVEREMAVFDEPTTQVRRKPKLRVIQGGGSNAFTARCTDVANAEKLVALYGTELRYVVEWGKWLVWDGKRWVLDEKGIRAHRLGVETVRAMMGEAAQELETAKAMPDDQDGATAKADAVKKAKTNIAWAKESQSASRIRALLDTARSDSGVTVSHKELDADPWKLNVRNGTIMLKTGKLLKPARHDLITKLAPVDYDPHARAPTWEKFLHHVFPNGATRSYIQRSIGYALTGSIEEHVLFFHYGDGARGKSTFLNVVHAILGDYAAKAPRKMLFTSRGERHPNELVPLFGARFVVCAEIEDGKVLDEALVKDLTGGDPIPTRRCNENYWEYMPTHKLFIAGNYKPVVRGDDEGIWRRMRLVPWTVQIPKEARDKKLFSKLRKELPGILAWAVKGCLAWQKEGLHEPKQVEDATAEYREESDRLGEFFTLRCLFEPEARVARLELHEEYKAYLEENGDPYPVSPRVFATKLRARGVSDGGTILAKCKAYPVDAWKGVRLLTQKERKNPQKTGGIGR